MTDRGPRLPVRRIFAVPLAIGAASAVGLATALIGDGAWDVVSWLTLAIPAIPVITAAWCPWGRRP